jgi:phosphatidylserine/phosphatidylglycerophosphate/cardiolipin synthase-like enzyme
MPNVTSIEPQVLVDLLALTLQDVDLKCGSAAEAEIVVISPWLSDVELSLHPSGRHARLSGVDDTSSLRFAECLQRLAQLGCSVRIGVLKYGASFAGLTKDPQKFSNERAVLSALFKAGAQIFLCPNMHAKGIVTPLGVITGTTNYTHSGLHIQNQNVNYFAFDHPDYAKNRAQLLANLQPQFRASTF